MASDQKALANALLTQEKARNDQATILLILGWPCYTGSSRANEPPVYSGLKSAEVQHGA